MPRYIVAASTKFDPSFIVRIGTDRIANYSDRRLLSVCQIPASIIDSTRCCHFFRMVKVVVKKVRGRN